MELVEEVEAISSTMPQLGEKTIRTGAENRHGLGIKLASAGLGACIADLVTYPLDMAKVRLQIRNSPGPSLMRMLANGDYISYGTIFPRHLGMFGTLYTIGTREGKAAIYAGLTAGLQRQLCFSTIRIGFYDDVKRQYQSLLGQEPGSEPKVYVRILAGLTTGAISVSVAQPTEVVKIKMQSGGVGNRPRYPSVWKAYHEIWHYEGVRGLWKGYVPNVTRNSITGVSELVTYDLIKQHIIKRNLMTDDFPCHVVSGFGAGFVATVVSSPVDVIKTRYMSSVVGEYTSIIQCATSLVRGFGPMALYKGFVPSFYRFGTWNILTFVFFEQLQRGFSYIDRAIF